jgi:hypothetical protein
MKKTIRSRVMDFVEKQGFVRRRDIVKFIRENLQGKRFDPVRDRGYYSTAFLHQSHRWEHGIYTYTMKSNPGYFMRPSKNDSRYFVQNAQKKYCVVKG